ncbi:VOC family protein [bacterium]|nr:VOC family protein [bacterium]
MSQTTNPSDPISFRSITPHLVCVGADKAIDFYSNAFGMKEIMRLPGPDGRLMHASMSFGDSMIMLAEAFPEYGSVGPQPGTPSPVSIHLNVPNVDEVFAQAVATGAKVVMPVDDMFWGDRYGIVEDPFGHRWSIATRTKDLSHEEVQKAMVDFTKPCD